MDETMICDKEPQSLKTNNLMRHYESDEVMVLLMKNQ